MSRFTQNHRINRIIDANINRAKEGLRVCEEITRFIFENRLQTAKLKGIRHRIGCLARGLGPQAKLLQERDSAKDTGRTIYADELKRKNLYDIFFANIQRVKESLRVLEEFSKLTSAKTALGFKKARYEIYELEKKIGERFK